MQIDQPARQDNPRATIEALALKYPGIFTTELAKVRPLRIGVFHTLVLWCPDIPPAQLRAALRAYCSHGAYLRLLVEGVPRIDLDGAQAGR
jgi:ProP effector